MTIVNEGIPNIFEQVSAMIKLLEHNKVSCEVCLMDYLEWGPNIENTDDLSTEKLF